MIRLYIALVLVVEAALIGLLYFVTPEFLALLLVPIVPLTLVAALLLRHVMGSPGYRARRLSPEDIVAYGLGDTFQACMERAAQAYTRLMGEFPLEAPYVLPLAYRVRVLFTWNLRELFHFIQLRSAKQGHASYRRIAQQVYGEIERVHPTLARYIRVDLSDYQLGRL